MPDGDILFQSTDLFDLGAPFQPQNSDTGESRERAVTLDADGNKACESDGFNVRTDFTASYKYCGTALRSDLDTLLTDFGEVKDGKLVTEVTVNYSNTDYPEISISGHNHAENPHSAGTPLRLFDVSALFPDAGGVGVPTLPDVAIAATSAAISASLTATLEHVDTQDGDGDQFAGQNRTGRVNVSVSGNGASTDVTLGGDYLLDDFNNSDENQGPQTFSLNAHQHVSGA